ncbi:MAG: hypothetical protein JSR44_14705 [Spirochaetes bacterium]|nr:hypothetical protein [Spirochaetota bacterium]
MFKRKTFLIPALVLAIAVGGLLWGQKIIDPQILAQQEEQKKKADDSGYGDIEIDNLHRELAASLRRILDLLAVHPMPPERQPIVKEADGGYNLPIASGESIKTISLRYLYNGNIILYPSGDAKSPKLAKVKLVFERTNPFGKEYKREKREVVNPTPLFFDNPEAKNAQSRGDLKVDRNDDIVLTYFESAFDARQVESFKEKEKIELKTIPFYEKKLDFVETYKKYLRRTAKRLQLTMEAIEINQKKKLRDLFELK